MKKALLVLLATVAITGTALAQTNAAGMAGAAASTNGVTAAKGDTIYSCPQCHMQAAKDGKCPMDGAAMKAMHVMKDKDGRKYVCGCPPNCDCTLKEGDKTQCTHNMPAKEVKLMKDGDKAAGTGKTE